MALIENLKQVTLPYNLLRQIGVTYSEVNPMRKYLLGMNTSEYGPSEPADWGSLYNVLNVAVKDISPNQTLSSTTNSLSISGGNSVPISAPRDNYVLVKSISDFPAPVGGMITLEDNTVYAINGAIDIGANALSMGDNTTLRGLSSKLDYVSSTTVNALINASTSFRVFECGFKADNGTIFNLAGSGVEICLMNGVRFFGTGGLGSVADYDLFEINTALFNGYSSGLIFSGAFVTLLFIDITFYDTVGVESLDFSLCSTSSLKILHNDFTIATGGNGISLAANSGNINADGFGFITDCLFILSGTATSTTGYSPFDTRWYVAVGNGKIKASDRLSPAGWANYSDSLTSPTITISNVASKLSIDGAGVTSESSYLPQSIINEGELWDTINNKITPISVGDSYNIRIDLDINSKTGSPNIVTLKLDIGNVATPTIVILDRDISVVKNPPYTVSVGFPIYSLVTFLANGGSLFLSTDTGTVNIASRSILIQRVSSGII